MAQWKLYAAAVPMAVLLSACDADPEIGGGGPPLPAGESLGELRRQAAQVLARYDKAAAAARPSASVVVSPPQWDPTHPPPGMSISAVKATPTATHLTVTFTGAVGPATQPCGADYYAEAVEGTRAIVVIVIAQPHAAGELCTLIGSTRTATLNLARPLDYRAVLEVREGLQVPVDPDLALPK